MSLFIFIVVLGSEFEGGRSPCWPRRDRTHSRRRRPYAALTGSCGPLRVRPPSNVRREPRAACGTSVSTARLGGISFTDYLPLVPTDKGEHVPLRGQLLARYRRAFSISGRMSPEPANSISLEK